MSVKGLQHVTTSLSIQAMKNNVLHVCLLASVIIRQTANRLEARLDAPAHGSRRRASVGRKAQINFGSHLFDWLQKAPVFGAQANEVYRQCQVLDQRCNPSVRNMVSLHPVVHDDDTALHVMHQVLRV